MRTVVLYIILFCLPGCTVLKNRSVNNADSSYVQREKFASSVSLKERTENDIRLVYSDSVKLTFMVEISPEGDFTYSPNSGYRGKAKVLKISGNAEVWKRGGVAGSAQKDLKIDSTSSQDVKKKVGVRRSQTSVTRERYNQSYFWMLIVAGAALIGWFFLKKRLKAQSAKR